mmetsp:Transcript_3157/g.19488  ORF Transcript_3157/g.19488 Transcript_3157/m.19488 type:complete len:263 (+) Transcript_3157:118-906(+)
MATCVCDADGARRTARDGSSDVLDGHVRPRRVLPVGETPASRGPRLRRTRMHPRRHRLVFFRAARMSHVRRDHHRTVVLQDLLRRVQRHPRRACTRVQPVFLRTRQVAQVEQHQCHVRVHVVRHIGVVRAVQVHVFQLHVVQVCLEELLRAFERTWVQIQPVKTSHAVRMEHETSQHQGVASTSARRVHRHVAWTQERRRQEMDQRRGAKQRRRGTAQVRRTSCTTSTRRHATWTPRRTRAPMRVVSAPCRTKEGTVRRHRS